MKLRTFSVMAKTAMVFCLLAISLISCSNNNLLNTSANDQSPLAPEIVAGGSSSRSASRLVSSDDQNFGSFSMIKASALNYNSMIEGTVPEGISSIGGLGTSESAVSLGPLVKKVESGSYAFFENEGATITSFLSGGEGECRQFDAYILESNVKYSRCYFYWPTNLWSYLGVDITEVWEYPDRKEVSVTLYNKDEGTVNKYLAVTDTTDELQRTSLFYGSYIIGDSAFTLDSYEKVGYIDFSKSMAMETSYAEKGSFLPAEYPDVSFLDSLHNKSFDLNNVIDVIIDYENLIPYVDFLEE